MSVCLLKMPSISKENEHQQTTHTACFSVVSLNCLMFYVENVYFTEQEKFVRISFAHLITKSSTSVSAAFHSLVFCISCGHNPR